MLWILDFAKDAPLTAPNVKSVFQFLQQWTLLLMRYWLHIACLLYLALVCPNNIPNSIEHDVWVSFCYMWHCPLKTKYCMPRTGSVFSTNYPESVICLPCFVYIAPVVSIYHCWLNFQLCRFIQPLKCYWIAFPITSKHNSNVSCYYHSHFVTKSVQIIRTN